MRKDHTGKRSDGMYHVYGVMYEPEVKNKNSFKLAQVFKFRLYRLKLFYVFALVRLDKCKVCTFVVYPLHQQFSLQCLKPFVRLCNPG